MKMLSPNRPLVLIMLGTPGAGKSFFARQFAETFNAPLVSYDRLRYELFSEPHYSKDEEAIIARIATNEIQELLKTEKTFIIDGGMSSRVSRSDIEKLAKPHNYKSLIIWVQTEPQAAKARATKRNPKRQYDEYNISISADMYESMSARVTEPSARESFLVISGKHTYATQAKMVLKKIVAPREETASTPQPYGGRPSEPTPPPITRRKNVTIQ